MAPTLTPAEAARRLGVSAKALRLYEERGLVTPGRTAAGYRAYGPDDLERAGEVAALRALGFSLAQVQRVLAGDPHGLEAALRAHEARLSEEARQLGARLGRLRALGGGLAEGKVPTVAELIRLAAATAPSAPIMAFDLPWPWGGERFELTRMRRLNYLIGPLGSGKTRFAMALAEHLPGAAFLGLDRAAADGADARAALAADPDLDARVQAALAWLVEDGATPSADLLALLVALEADGPDVLVIDMVEQGLDEATQAALAAHLRRAQTRPLFLMTRSSAILDLDAVGPDATILLCPANHSPPVEVVPCPGAPGYESVAGCLATPTVRARTEGVVAVRRAS